MKYLIDANIFLQAALTQDNEAKCKEFLDRVSSGKADAKTTLFHMDASAIVMENRGMNQNEIGNFYYEAYSSEGLEIVNMGVSARLNALANKDYSGLDDGLLFQAFKELEVDKIVTYDDDFKEENRTTPEKVLKNTK